MKRLFGAWKCFLQSRQKNTKPFVKQELIKLCGICEVGR